MRVESRRTGPVKAWIEPDRLTFLRAFPGQTLWFLGFMLLAVVLAVRLHPLFWVLFSVLVFRQATMAAHLRALFRDGRLHPARLLTGSHARLATLVRLEGEVGPQDAVMISRAPRRWHGQLPPWGDARAPVILAGQAPALRPLSPDFAGKDPEPARRALARIPERQWEALSQALSQVPGGAEAAEGLHPVDLGRVPWFGAVSEIEPAGSLPGRLTEGDVSLWCAGFSCIERPALAPSERVRVMRLRRHALLRGVLFGVTAVASWGALPRLGLDTEPASTFPQLAAFSLLLAGPFLLLKAVRRLLEVRALGRDLAQGTLLRFGGQLSSFDSLLGDADLARLVREGLVTPEPGLEQELVVLPTSGRLLYANGRWAPVSGRRMHVARVAEGPDPRLKLELPRELQTERARALQVRRRRLIDAEVAEIRRQAAALRRPVRATFVSLALLALSLSSLRAEGLSGVSSQPGGSLALLLLFVAGLSTFRRFRLARRLSHDAALGWVLTVDHDADSHTAMDWDLPAQGVETLMNARIDWTVNKRPAAWRRYRGGLTRER